MDTEGLCIWGKKINQVEANRYTKLVHGTTYLIRNLHSHMLMHVPDNNDDPGISIRQGADNGLSSQLWRIKDAGDGLYYLFPHHSRNNLVMQVKNGTGENRDDLIVNPLNGTDKQKFMIYYNKDGYFRILSKVSNFTGCADVAGFSLADGGIIFQWEYTGNLNQIWRFEKIDSIAIDTTLVDSSDFAGVKAHELTSLKVYPNPSLDGKFTVDISSLESYSDIRVSVVDLRGIIIYSKEFKQPSIHKFDMDLPKGIYVIRINSGTEHYLKKLIVQ
ncbi:hypothetical protein ES705_36247 [subsurface metagenome]